MLVATFAHAEFFQKMFVPLKIYILHFDYSVAFSEIANLQSAANRVYFYLKQIRWLKWPLV
jgi:hypothetical protein